MKIQRLSTVWDPGYRYSAPQQEASILGSRLCLLPETLVICWPIRCVSGQGTPRVSVGNLWGSLKVSIIKTPWSEEGEKEWVYFVIDLLLTSFNKRRNRILQLGSPATAELWINLVFPVFLLSFFFPWYSTQRVFLFTSLFSLHSVLGLDFFSYQSLAVLCLISPQVLLDSDVMLNNDLMCYPS